MPSSSSSRQTIGLLALALLAGLAGCLNGRGWNPLGPPAPPVLSRDATVGEVVAHLNANIERCSAWQSHDVEVKSNNVGPLSVDATVAVESPRNFRMVVEALGMPQADLGSNRERMWFWINQKQADGGQYSYTCKHSDLPRAQAKMGLPFRPHWLMEVMGVTLIDAGSVTMRTDPGNNGLFLLESEVPSQNGSPLIRRITVDAQTGTVVAHALADAASGRPVAEARLSDYRPDAETGVILPHHVTLSYPEMGFELSMTFGEIEVNPIHFPATTWQPTYASAYPFIDILTERVVTLDEPVVEQASVPWNPAAD